MRRHVLQRRSDMEHPYSKTWLKILEPATENGNETHSLHQKTPAVVGDSKSVVGDSESIRCSVEEAEDLATGVLSACLLVVDDAGRGGEDEVPELAGREEVGGPLLNVLDRDVEPGADAATLVDTADELDNDLAGTVVVNDLELPDVALLHHDGQELDNDLGVRPDQDLGGGGDTKRKRKRRGVDGWLERCQGGAHVDAVQRAASASGAGWWRKSPVTGARASLSAGRGGTQRSQLSALHHCGCRRHQFHGHPSPIRRA